MTGKANVFLNLLKSSFPHQHFVNFRRPFLPLIRNASSKVQRKSCFADIKIDDVCLHDFYFERFQKFGDLTAFINVANGQKLTYNQLSDQSNRLACGLHQHGLKKGDVITICLPNCPEYAVITLAAVARGGVTSGINPDYTEVELENYLKTSNAKFVFVRGGNLPKLLRAALNLEHQIQEIFIVDNNFDASTKNSPIKVSKLSDLLSNTGSQALPTVRWNTKTDLALLPFSSGTTGLPKGIMLSHFNFVSLIQILDQCGIYDKPDAGDRVVSISPFFHIYGLVQLFMTLWIGATSSILPQFDKSLYLKVVERYRVPILFVVPPLLNFLAKDGSVKNYDLSHVRTCYSGAAPMSKEIAVEIRRKFPNMRVLQGYGMTEMSGISHIMPPDLPQSKDDSCGMLLPNYETKVTSIENGEELDHNQVGEVCVKGQTCMLGYYNNQKETQEIYDKEMFLHTGDLGYYDKDGALYIVDRLKELIKVRGFQVAPAELEDILLSHPDVSDAAVIGIPDDSAGEVPKAFVVLRDSTRLNEKQIADFVNKKVIYYKSLKGGVEIVKEIPKAPSGKVLRRLLKQQHVKNESNVKQNASMSL